MSGKLSTHVLDIAHGRPAAGMRITLHAAIDLQAPAIKTVITNADGRTDQPLLEGNALKSGNYTLLFHVADYFHHMGHPDAGKFLVTVPVHFAIADANAGYHVPLLVSPWSYSTYRGS